MDRRKFIKKTMANATALLVLPDCLFAINEKVKKENRVMNILVVSGWQDVNIGDIAHTPGLLHILEEKLPDANIVLWKRSRSEEVEGLLKKNFPRIDILYGNPDQDYQIKDQKLLNTIEHADVFIHGSGPHVVAQNCLEAWSKLTDKPFGIFGTTIEHINPELAMLLQKALFIYTRETHSIQKLKEAGVYKPEIRFVPDATFYLHLQNEENAGKCMEKYGLREKEFLCVIPRLRKTPYWLIRPQSYTEQQIEEITLLNETWKEKDHAKAREAIIRWVRETKHKVLVCPEMTYQVDIMDELLIDPLPEDVKPFVSKRGYWLPDEAASLYKKASAILSFECHSPIIALRNETPAFYLRQPEDTIKGQMYYDLGYNDWIFEIDLTTGTEIAERLMEVYSDPREAESYRKKGMDKANTLFREGVNFIANKVKIK